VFIVQFDSEHCPRQNGMHHSFDFDMCFFHNAILQRPVPKVDGTRQTSRKQGAEGWTLAGGGSSVLRFPAFVVGPGSVAVSAPATKIIAPATTATLFALAGDVDTQCTAAQFFAVEGVDGFLGLFR